MLVRRSHFKPEELQSLRNLEDKVVFRALSGLRSSIVLVNTLLELNRGIPSNNPAVLDRSSHIERQLVLILHRLEAHVNAAGILSQKIQAALGLVSHRQETKKDLKLTVGFPIKLANLLDMQSKESSDQINKHMLQLTRESVDDNATVKVITVCTLIYLPASFTAVRYHQSIFTPY